MSGYNEDTGIFEFTGTKLDWWFRREDLPDPCVAVASMYGLRSIRFYASLFEHFGCDVLKIGSGYLHVLVTPERAWEILSGQPSNPERAAHYYKRRKDRSDIPDGDYRRSLDSSENGED